VISIIAVMIIGAGLDKTGIMSRVAAFIMRIGGSTEARIIPLISGTVGVISSFMQNVGAAALFLPVVSRISARTGLPMSRLLMPMGFCAILGGTMTMVGSSPLILLNDLILTSNKALPEGVRRCRPSSCSTWRPSASRCSPPASSTSCSPAASCCRRAAPTSWRPRPDGLLRRDLRRQRLQRPRGAGAADSPLVGTSVDEMERRWHVRVAAVDKGDGVRLGASGVDRSLGIEAGTLLGLLGGQEHFDTSSRDRASR
jgi:hypothetical protein